MHPVRQMKRSTRLATIAIVVSAGAVAVAQQSGSSLPPAIELPAGNAINNPYRMIENWPHLGTIKPGAAIGIVPDGQGGVWLQHRSDPGIVHADAKGEIVKRFDVTFSSAHGLCRDRDEPRAA